MPRGAPCFALIVASLLTSCCHSAGASRDTSKTESDPKQLSKAFFPSASPQATSARNREEATFYVQLQAVNLRPNLQGKKCIDQSFLAWIRKFFNKEAKSITLVATITGPDETANEARKIPLFEIDKDETKNPPLCLTDIVASEPITSLYVARRTADFHLDVQALTKQVANVTAAQTTVSAAADLLSLTGGSSWLLKNVAKSQAEVTNAVRKVDNSLGANWSQTSQETYHFDMNAWPIDDDWDHHFDRADFAVGSLVPTAGGITVDQNRLPTLRISLRFVNSVFGGGPGHYISEDDILATHLTSKTGDALGDVFKLGVSGFTTDQAIAITDPNAMANFCNSMRQNFPNFLTTDDALAARHAVLLRRTNFYNLAKLKTAIGCETPKDIERLKKLNSAFEFPDLDRPSGENRSAFVKKRGEDLVSTALIANSKDKLTAIMADPKTFTFFVSNDVRTVFPEPSDGKTWGGATGTDAINQLIEAGGFRSGCWQALPTQNLRNLVGMALSKRTGNSAAILVEFDADYPGPGAETTADLGKVRKISFFSVAAIHALTDLPDWPSSSCPLA
jgi:hypothetical protein